MTWTLFPTALWAVAMLTGLGVSLRILRRMVERRSVQRKWRHGDLILAEIADRNVVTEWLRAGGFACLALAGIAALAGQVAVSPTHLGARWSVVGLLIAGGVFFVAGAVRDDRHAKRVLRLALDGLGEKASP